MEGLVPGAGHEDVGTDALPSHRAKLTPRTPLHERCLKKRIEDATDELNISVEGYTLVARPGSLRKWFGQCCERTPLEDKDGDMQKKMRKQIEEKIKILRSLWELKAGDHGISELEMALEDARAGGDKLRIAHADAELKITWKERAKAEAKMDLLWSYCAGVDMMSTLPELRMALDKQGCGGAPLEYYFWFVKTLAKAMALLSLLAIPTCVSNASGDYLTYHYGILQTTLHQSLNETFSESLFWIARDVNLKMLHARLDPSIFNVQRDQAFLSPFLWSALLLSSTMLLLGFLHLAQYTFEVMHRDARDDESIESAAVEKMVAVMEPSNNSSLMSILRWAQDGEITEGDPQLISALREITNVNHRSPDLEKQVREMLLDYMLGTTDRGYALGHDSIVDVFIPLWLGYDGNTIPLLKIYVYFKSAAACDDFCNALPRSFDIRRTLREALKLNLQLSFRTIENKNHQIFCGRLYVRRHAPSPSDIIFDNFYASTRVRVTSAILYLICWAAVVFGLFTLCSFFLKANWEAEWTLRDTPMLLLFVQIVVLTLALNAAISIVDIMTFSLGWLIRADQWSENALTVAWQSFLVNISVVPLLTVPQVMNWSDSADASIYGFKLDWLSNQLGYANCAELYGWHGLNTTVPDCNHVQITNASTLVNSLFAAMFLSQCLKISNVLPYITQMLYTRVVWPLYFYLVPRYWQCFTAMGAHSRKIKYKHFYLTYQPYLFDMPLHWIRILYIMTLCLIVAPGIPLAFPTTTVALMTQYAADKYWLLKLGLPPPKVGVRNLVTLPKFIVIIFTWLLVAQCIAACMWWQFTTVDFVHMTQTITEQAVPFNHAAENITSVTSNAINSTATNITTHDVSISNQDPSFLQRSLLAIAPLIAAGMIALYFVEKPFASYLVHRYLKATRDNGVSETTEDWLDLHDTVQRGSLGTDNGSASEDVTYKNLIERWGKDVTFESVFERWVSDASTLDEAPERDYETSTVPTKMTCLARLCSYFSVPRANVDIHMSKTEHTDKLQRTDIANLEDDGSNPIELMSHNDDENDVLGMTNIPLSNVGVDENS